MIRIDIGWTYPCWCVYIALFGSRLSGECVAGYVTCEPAHTEDLCQWPSVLRSVCYVGERFACRELPNNSFLFPYCMVSIIPVFPPQCRIRVYFLVCAMHTLRSGYWFLYIVCVLYVLLLQNYLIVLHMSCCKCYIWVCKSRWICAGLNYFVSELLMYSVCGTEGYI
jgi:hypothetical protein